MDLDKFDVILDSNDKDFTEKLAKAIGLKPGEELHITTPQFERVDGRAITYRPKTHYEYAALLNLDTDSIKKIGCQSWKIERDGSPYDGRTLWLYPHEWYDHIPNGTIVVDINGEEEAFEQGKTDDDKRFGALAFGFIQNTN